MKAQNLYHIKNKEMKLFSKSLKSLKNEELKKSGKTLCVHEMLMVRGGTGDDGIGIVQK